MRHSVQWCIKQQTNTPSTLLSDLCVGTFPVHINLTHNPPGVYSLEITATDVFNLTDKNIISYTSGYLKTTKTNGYYIALQGWVTYEVQIVDYKVMLISFTFITSHHCTMLLHSLRTSSSLLIKFCPCIPEPYLQIRFINSSPRVSGSRVVADFTINRRTTSVECFINGQGSKKECKSVLQTALGKQ